MHAVHYTEAFVVNCLDITCSIHINSVNSAYSNMNHKKNNLKSVINLLSNAIYYVLNGHMYNKKCYKMSNEKP